MPVRRQIRCSNCGHETSIASEMPDACPRCLEPLSGGPGSAIPEPVLPTHCEKAFRAWVEAFNARNLDGMLNRMSEQVVFHPLRFDGIRKEYHGHAEVRDWFRRLGDMGHEHRLWVLDVHPVGGDHVLASGEVRGPDEELLTPFWSLFRLREDRLLAVYNYLTDPEIVQHLRIDGV